MRQSQEKLWAVGSHLGSAFLGPLVALVVFLVHKDKARYVGHHAHQAMWFFFTVWIVGFVLSRLPLVGFLVYPLGIVALALGVVGSVNALAGHWWEYPVVGRIWRKALGSSV